MTPKPRPRGLDATAACDGKLRVRVRFLPAQDDGGGDIYDVADTSFGLRLLIGDVMGTGVPASQTGASVLEAWRAIARAEPTLAGAAVRLHGLITRSEHPERFVTALMVNFTTLPWAEFVCCGHPPPLLLRDGAAIFIDTGEAAPPLGLLDMTDGWCSPGTFRFTRSDRLLMYTDGVSEARDSSGAFFPLAARAAQADASCDGDEDRLLDTLLTGLREHIGSSSAAVPDDILLMLVSCEE